MSELVKVRESDNRRHVAMLMLLQGADVRTVADHLGITTQTLGKWRREPEFDEAYNAAQAAIMDRVQAKMSHASGLVIDSVIEVAIDRLQPGVARISAARLFFELQGHHKLAPIRRPAMQTDIASREDLLRILAGVPSDILEDALEFREQNPRLRGA